MRKVLITISVLACLFSFSVVGFASEDGAALFNAYCRSCHGADGSKAPYSGVAPIKGWKSSETLKALKGYKDGSFGGARKQIMTNTAKRLSDEQMKSIADFVATL